MLKQDPETRRYYIEEDDHPIIRQWWGRKEPLSDAADVVQVVGLDVNFVDPDTGETGALIVVSSQFAAQPEGWPSPTVHFPLSEFEAEYVRTSPPLVESLARQLDGTTAAEARRIDAEARHAAKVAARVAEIEKEQS